MVSLLVFTSSPVGTRLLVPDETRQAYPNQSHLRFRKQGSVSLPRRRSSKSRRYAHRIVFRYWLQQTYHTSVLRSTRNRNKVWSHRPAILINARPHPSSVNRYAKSRSEYNFNFARHQLEVEIIKPSSVGARPTSVRWKLQQSALVSLLLEGYNVMVIFLVDDRSCAPTETELDTAKCLRIQYNCAFHSARTSLPIYSPLINQPTQVAYQQIGAGNSHAKYPSLSGIVMYEPSWPSWHGTYPLPRQVSKHCLQPFVFGIVQQIVSPGKYDPMAWP